MLPTILVILLITVVQAERIAIFSDFNSSYGATHYEHAVTRALNYIITQKPDLVIMAGDVIAGQSHTLPDSRFPEMWQAFDTHIASPLRDHTIPYALAVGNHDAALGFSRERTAASTYWQQAQPNLDYVETGTYPFNYSFLHQGDDVSIFFLMLDASSATLAVSNVWLAQELHRPEAINADYRIAVGHLPLYGVASYKNKAGEVLTHGDMIRQNFEDLGIDMYISGHHAAYYQGKRGHLKMIFSGGIGGRALIGQSHATSAIVILDITSANVQVQGIDISDFSTIENLPSSVEGRNGQVELWE